MINLIKDWEFRKDIETSVAQSVCSSISKVLPVEANEAAFICRYYNVNHRFDFIRGGQDSRCDRINFKTDGRGIIINCYIG